MIGKKIYVLLIACLSVLYGCHAGKNKKDPVHWFSYETTPCFGKCPTFSLEVRSDGFMKIDKKENLDQIGVFTRQLSKAELNQLIENETAMNFCSLKPVYGGGVSDLPSTFIRKKCGEKVKSVQLLMNYPPEVVAFTELIDQWANSGDWKEFGANESSY